MKRKYKFRAACQLDMERFFHQVEKVGSDYWPASIKTLPPLGVEREVSFTSDLNHQALLQIMSKVTDGHVMMETLALESEYTGKRKYVKMDPKEITLDETNTFIVKAALEENIIKHSDNEQCGICGARKAGQLSLMDHVLDCSYADAMAAMKGLDLEDLRGDEADREIETFIDTLSDESKTLLEGILLSDDELVVERLCAAFGIEIV